MLEQYLKNYFSSLGLQRPYVDAINPQEDGSFSLLIDGKLVCSIEEQYSKPAEFVFTLCLNSKSLEPKELLELYAVYSDRLKLTPMAGKACLFTLPEGRLIGLMYRMVQEQLEQSVFNLSLDRFARTASYLIGNIELDELNFAEQSSNTEDHYGNLLAELKLSREFLQLIFNRLNVDGDFGVLLEYHHCAMTLKLINALNQTLTEDEKLGLLSTNPELKAGLQFNYEAGGMYLEQALDLKDTRAEQFALALSLQKQVLAKLEHEFKDNPALHNPQHFSSLSLLQNMPV